MEIQEQFNQQVDFAHPYIEFLRNKPAADEALRRLKLRGVMTDEDKETLEAARKQYLSENPEIEDYGFAEHAISTLRYAYEKDWDLDNGNFAKIHLANRHQEILLTLRYAEFMYADPDIWRAFKRVVSLPKDQWELWSELEEEQLEQAKLRFCDVDPHAPPLGFGLMSAAFRFVFAKARDQAKQITSSPNYKYLSKRLTSRHRATVPDYFANFDRFDQNNRMYAEK